MQVEQEISCDAYVMISGSKGTAYARDIVRLVRGAQGAVALSGLYNTLGKKSIIRERIKTILSFKKQYFSSKVIPLIVAGLFLCSIIPLLAVSFNTIPAVSGSGQGIYGVWINKEYSGNHRRSEFQKIIQSYSGSWSVFCLVSSPKPRREGDRTVVKKWSDVEGNIRYKVTSESAVACWGDFNKLHRVSSSGDIWEYVSMPAHLGWPTEIDPNDPEYRIYYRQK